MQKSDIEQQEREILSDIKEAEKCLAQSQSEFDCFPLSHTAKSEVIYYTGLISRLNDLLLQLRD